MRMRSVLAFSLSLVLAAAALAQKSEAGKAKPAPKASALAPVVWPAGDLKWTDVEGAPPGVKGANLFGDSAKGPFGAVQKFPAGFSAPLHTHSADLRIVVVSGTLLHGPEGKPEVRMTAGSYLYLPSSYRHTTGCDKASECVLFIEGNRKFDVKLVEASKAKAPAKK
jgi:quercetin dioxygenase-like cupin family protein